MYTASHFLLVRMKRFGITIKTKIMDIKEQSLKDALNKLVLSELPKAYREGDGFWLEAIVLVRKYDMTHSYAIAKRGADCIIKYTNDFGTIAPIASLISIHPFLFLNKNAYYPYKTIDEKKKAIISFLGEDDDIINAVMKMSDDKVEETILEIAIKNQYADNERLNERNRILVSVGRDVTPIRFDDDNSSNNELQDSDNETPNKTRKGRPRKDK